MLLKHKNNTLTLTFNHKQINTNRKYVKAVDLMPGFAFTSADDVRPLPVIEISPNSIIKEAIGATQLEQEWAAAYLHSHAPISFLKGHT